jgi:hypothetical protein
MNSPRHIFCYGNLGLFLSSFLLFIFFSFKIQKVSPADDRAHIAYSQKSPTSVPGPLQSVSEKEESETEVAHEVGLDVFFILSLFTDFHTYSAQDFEHHSQQRTAVPKSPVYLLNSVFRI